MSLLTACALGGVAYRDGLALQESLVQARADGRTGDWLLFPEHPPVLTLGRSFRAGSLRVEPATLARSGIEVFEVARGGDATWHGPGQLVGYPICDLSGRGRDLHRFLRSLEQALIATLARFAVASRTVPGRTGVWVGEHKIASIGIAVRRWVTYHGFALNVSPDLSGFDLIHPCGLRGIQMTALQVLLGDKTPPLAEVRQAAAREVARRLGARELRWAQADEAWSAASLSPAAAVAETHLAEAPR